MFSGNDTPCRHLHHPTAPRASSWPWPSAKAILLNKLPEALGPHSAGWEGAGPPCPQGAVGCTCGGAGGRLGVAGQVGTPLWPALPSPPPATCQQPSLFQKPQPSPCLPAAGQPHCLGVAEGSFRPALPAQMACVLDEVSYTSPFSVGLRWQGHRGAPGTPLKLAGLRHP